MICDDYLGFPKNVNGKNDNYHFMMHRKLFILRGRSLNK